MTHSATLFCYPQEKRNIERRSLFDTTLIEDVRVERETLSNIYSQLIKNGHPITDWCYDYFHSAHIELINNIRFRLLNIDELVEL